MSKTISWWLLVAAFMVCAYLAGLTTTSMVERFDIQDARIQECAELGKTYKIYSKDCYCCEKHEFGGGE